MTNHFHDPIHAPPLEMNYRPPHPLYPPFYDPYMRHQSGPAFVPQVLTRFEPLPVYDPVYAGTSAGTREPASRPQQQHYESAQEEYRDESTSPPPQPGVKIVRKRRRLLSQGELPRDEAMRKHFCPVPGCGKKFARPSALKTHNLSHTKEKPFTCGTCERGFAVLSNMKRHCRVLDHDESSPDTPPLATTSQAHVPPQVQPQTYHLPLPDALRQEYVGYYASITGSTGLYSEASE